MVLPIVLLVLAAVVALWTLATISALVFSLIPWAIVGMITGWVASRLTGARLGVMWMMLTGIAGSWLGGALFARFLPGAIGGLVSPVLGAVIILLLARVVARPSLTAESRPRFGRTY
jgi:uncharacterized membrane protein YeaQ/YmgE (transglycosylase-associated protein family)